ncbi:MAG TPA: glycoside hydrolase [Armatimonadetes bacterium]|nr:cellulase family glycosylhydrolase [Armatimonadota bacterium]HCD99732.1 glycoside hydrolase [Armatimonadota bacterium]
MPRYGFNFQWMFVWREGATPRPPDLRALDFLAKHGFDFVRMPMDYRFWTRDWRYTEPDRRVWESIDRCLEATRERGLHLSLNLHRAPGYCINANHLEKHNLWTDREAQDGFVFLWREFAERYKGVPNDLLSFDLVNEPPSEGQYGFTRAAHEALVRRTVAAIREVDPDREVAIDGIGGGHYAMPELADLGVVHSGRGYMPMALSHYRAHWWDGHKGLPEPKYPGLVWNGVRWNAEALRWFYQPWRWVEREGVRVHIGEFGCYNQTPNDAALRWFEDLLGLYREFRWGFALWTFTGEFGIAEHGRPGAAYEEIDGYRVDRRLFELLLGARVSG